MLGIILADLYAMKKQMLILGGVAVLYLFLGIASSEPSTSMAIMTLFSVMFVLSSFTYEEQCQFDIFANTLPLKRKNIVFSKYLISLMSLCAGILLSILAVILSALINHNFNMNQIYTLIVVVIFGTLFLSISLPILFKVGPERARLIMIVIYIVPFFTAWGVIRSDVIDINTLVNVTLEKLIVPAVVVNLIVFAISVLCSLKIYEKKEF